MNEMQKIVHISTVHNRYDTRILQNQCVSLAEYYDVTLLVCDGKEDELHRNVSISSMGQFSNKFARLFFSIFIIHIKILRMRFDVYHLHDPELFLLGYVLKLFRRKVIIDLHEDYQEDLLLKTWIRKPLRKTIAKFYDVVSRFILPKCDKVIVVTEHIGLKSSVPSYSVILNYPNSFRIMPISETSNKIYDFVYVGSISAERGFYEILNLTRISAASTLFVGDFASSSLSNWADENKLHGVEFAGYIKPDDVAKFSAKAKIGVHLITDNTNLLNGIPLKILEYVAMGLPVLCTDSVKWRKTFAGLDTIVYVDPKDDDALLAGVKACNEFTAPQLSDSQKKLVRRYSWESQAKILISTYRDVLS